MKDFIRINNGSTGLTIGVSKHVVAKGETEEFVTIIINDDSPHAVSLSKTKALAAAEALQEAVESME